MSAYSMWRQDRPKMGTQFPVDWPMEMEPSLVQRSTQKGKANTSLDTVHARILNPTVLTRYFFSCSNFSSNFRIFRLRLWMCLVSWAMVCGSLPPPQPLREELRGLPRSQGGREWSKTTVFLNAFAALQTKLPGLLERSRGQCIIWWVYHSSICSLMETPDHSTLLWANVITDFNERMSGYWSRKHISYSLEETNLRLERDSPIVAWSPLEYMNHTY